MTAGTRRRAMTSSPAVVDSAEPPQRDLGEPQACEESTAVREGRRKDRRGLRRIKTHALHHEWDRHAAHAGVDVVEHQRQAHDHPDQHAMVRVIEYGRDEAGGDADDDAATEADHKLFCEDALED